MLTLTLRQAQGDNQPECTRKISNIPTATGVLVTLSLAKGHSKHGTPDFNYILMAVWY